MHISDIESVIEVVHVGICMQSIIVKEIGTMSVDKGVKSETGSPRISEIMNVDAMVAVGLSLTPQKESVFSRFLL